MTVYESEGRAIVYIDESGFACDMPRTHGYAPIGERCVAKQDWHAKGRTNVIGALINHLLLTVGLFETNIDADVFYGWVVYDLLPKLPENAIIVMDNATFHKRTDIEMAITAAGHILEYLPPYSPDLNPIEHKWSQSKSLRRTHQCSVDDLFKLFPL